MTGEKNLFTSIEYENIPKETIVFGDNSKGEVTGFSKISLTHDNAITNTLLKFWGTICCLFHNFVEGTTIVSLLMRCDRL